MDQKTVECSALEKKCSRNGRENSLIKYLRWGCKQRAELNENLPSMGIT